MSVEQAIKKLMAERATLPVGNSANGDQTPPKQGNSETPPTTDLGDMPGQNAASGVAQTGIAAKGDPKSAKVQAMESITKEELKESVAELFKDQTGLAEGFVDKAADLFEAAVIGRVNAEMIDVQKRLEETAQAELTELKATLSEQVNAYLSEMILVWANENKLAIEKGIKAEIAESFMIGLKNLFVENYIEVPEDKVDIVATLTTDLEESKLRVNEEVNKKLAIKEELIDLKKQLAVNEASKGMTDTDAERFKSLVEGIEFDTQDQFAEKIAVIKEAHFKKAAKKSGTETMVTENTGAEQQEQVVDPAIQRIATALSRGSRFGNM